MTDNRIQRALENCATCGHPMRWHLPWPDQPPTCPSPATGRTVYTEEEFDRLLDSLEAEPEPTP